MFKCRELGFVNIIFPHGSDATPVIYNPVGLFRRVTAELMCCVWSRRLFTKSDSSSLNAGPCVLSSHVFIDRTICSCVCRFNIVLRADVCVWKRECVNLTAIQRRWKCLMWCCRGILLNHIYIRERAPSHAHFQWHSGHESNSVINTGLIPSQSNRLNICVCLNKRRTLVWSPIHRGHTQECQSKLD